MCLEERAFLARVLDHAAVEHPQPAGGLGRVPALAIARIERDRSDSLSGEGRRTGPLPRRESSPATRYAIVLRPASGSPRLPRSEQRSAVGRGNTPTWRPGGRICAERGLDGVGDELGGLGVDGDVAAQQHPADHLAGVPGCVLEAVSHVGPLS